MQVIICYHLPRCILCVASGTAQVERKLHSRRQCVLVYLQAKPTDARYTLRDPAQVMTFLQRLVAWGLTPANAWHTARSCNGEPPAPKMGCPFHAQACA